MLFVLLPFPRFSLTFDVFVERAAVEGSFAFSFVEGVLVKAVREGHWVLLDEINLASAETLQRLSGLLEVNAALQAVLSNAGLFSLLRSFGFVSS